jgi:hypothetical protein
LRYCVFCGSRSGIRPAYAAAAEELGRLLAQNGIGLVYGGASVGLMGSIANAALDAGGEVIGVIPRDLVRREVAHTALGDLRVVDTMHQRKALMAELSDGFIALPGGVGTLDETFEIWTWAQLGHHNKPCALLNVEGYYDKLNSFLDLVATEGFLRPEHRAGLICQPTPQQVLEAMRKHCPAQAVSKWQGRD